MQFQIIANWEVAAGLIVQRERLLERLEQFERFASDPNRFFTRIPPLAALTRPAFLASSTNAQQPPPAAVAPLAGLPSSLERQKEARQRVQINKV